jgi:hypothetical protein
MSPHNSATKKKKRKCQETKKWVFQKGKKKPTNNDGNLEINWFPYQKKPTQLYFSFSLFQLCYTTSINTTFISRLGIIWIICESSFVVVTLVKRVRYYEKNWLDVWIINNRIK